ncbi:MAG: beta-class carbonic anhydrase [Carbonactinosporaceae bacterium]
MSAIDRLVTNSLTYQRAYEAADLAMPPGLGVAVIACMDARLNVYGVLGLDEGDAHVIRNAGGVVTDDVIRSLVISQRLLGTREVLLIHHADCGMRTFSDDAFKAQIEADVGIRPSWSPEAFADPAADVRHSVRRITANPFVPYKDAVRGFVFDEKNGALNEVG